MEALVRQLLERASGEGGESWLRRCLSDTAVEEERNSGDSGVPAEPSQTLRMTQQEETPVRHGRPSCSVLLEKSRQASVPAEEVCMENENGGAEGGAMAGQSGRGRKKRRSYFPSPVMRVEHREREGWTAVRNRRGRTHEASVLQEEVTVQQRGWHADIPQVLPIWQAPQGSDRRMLLEAEAGQETVQRQAAGESCHLSVLSGLVNSLSSLIQSLVPRMSENVPVTCHSSS